MATVDEGALEPSVRHVDEARPTDEEIRRYLRSPRDLLRLIAYVLVTIAVVAITIALEDPVVGFEEDVLRVFDVLSPAVERVLHGSLEWIGLVVTLAIWLVPLVTRRYRLFGYIAVANVVAYVLMWAVLRLIDRDQPEQLVSDLAQRAGVRDATTTGELSFARLAASFTVLGPFVSVRWRRAGMASLAVLVLLRLLAAAELPAHLVIALPLGAAVGSGVLLAFGRPDHRPTLAAIRIALIESGLPVGEVRAAKVDARGSTPYFATLDAGRAAYHGDAAGRTSGLFVKVLGEEERAADLLFRGYRFLRLKDVGDERPFSSLRRAVEHEAFVSLAARDVGVRTPRMRKVATVGRDSMLIAYDLIDGRSVDGVAPDDVTDELLAGVFRQLAILRQNRIAHRDLRLANVFVTPQGEAWLIDFGFAELAVDERLLDADVAQVLAAMAVVAGPQRPVRIAVDVLGRTAVADALPRLQLHALSGATQTALKAHEGLLRSLQQEVQRQAGVERVRFAELERVDRKALLVVAVVAAATYFVLPLLADLSGVVSQVEAADWWWLPILVITWALTDVGSAIRLAGAVPRRVRAGPLVLCQVASSFAGRLVPAGVGGMELNIRYLQKQAVDPAIAVSSVGRSAVAGIVVHISLIGVFVVWAGRDPFDSIDFPDPHWFALGLAIALGFAAAGLVIPATRRVLVDRLWPIMRRALDGVSEVVRRPTKVVALIGGSTLTSIGDVLALYISVHAFGGGLALATVGAVYLVGAAVASAAPTPGGLGAIEAALVGGLVAAGLETAVAVPAVFLFRLATFWLPILPGWLSFRWLQRREYL